MMISDDFEQIMYIYFGEVKKILCQAMSLLQAIQYCLQYSQYKFLT